MGLAARDNRGPLPPSIVGSFCPLPWLEYAGYNVVLPSGRLVLEAAQVPLGTMHEDVQNESTRATTRDGPGDVVTAVLWPRYGGPELQPKRHQLKKRTAKNTRLLK
jgi:hypothetical protein